LIQVGRSTESTSRIKLKRSPQIECLEKNHPFIAFPKDALLFICAIPNAINTFWHLMYTQIPPTSSDKKQSHVFCYVFFGHLYTFVVTCALTRSLTCSQEIIVTYFLK
jgi:hypothetical protein